MIKYFSKLCEVIMDYSRHEQRKFAMQIIYTYDQNKLTFEDACDQVFANFAVSSEAISLASDTIKNLEKIDSLIESKLKNYHFDRLNAVDKAILRLCVSELLNKTAKAVAINEALELTEEFSDNGDKKAVHFNNAVLDNIAKEL